MADNADQHMADAAQQQNRKRINPLINLEALKKRRSGHDRIDPNGDKIIPPAIYPIIEAYAQKAAASLCKIRRLKTQKIKLEEHKQTNTFPREIDRAIKCPIKSEGAIQAMVAAKSSLLNTRIEQVSATIEDETNYAANIEEDLRKELVELTSNLDASLITRLNVPIRSKENWAQTQFHIAFVRARENLLVEYLAKQRADELKANATAEKKEKKRNELTERQQQQATQADIDSLKKQIEKLKVSKNGQRGGSPAPPKANGDDIGKGKKKRAKGKKQRAAPKRH